MSAEFELASPPFDTSEVAAAKRGLKSAIERIEAEALPAWIRQPERAECANDCSATADLLPDQGAYRFLDASEIAAAKQGLERAIGRIKAEAIPARRQQPERVVCANDCPATTDLPAEIEGACPSFYASEIATAEPGLQSATESIEAEAIPEGPRQAQGAARANDCPAKAELPAEIEGASPDGSEIAAAMQRLESAIERIKAEAIPACLQPSEHAVCANDCPATAVLPTEIEGAFPPFHAPEIVAGKQGLASATESIEAQAIPDWLRQPERDNRALDRPATASNQNEDSPGPLKRLWTRVTGRTAGSHDPPPGQDTWLTNLLERASDEAHNDEHDFVPKRTHVQ